LNPRFQGIGLPGGHLQLGQTQQVLLVRLVGIAGFPGQRLKLGQHRWQPELPQPEGVPSPLEETRPSPQGTYGNRRSEAPPSPYKGSSGLPPGSGKPNGPNGKAPVEGPNGLKRPAPNPSGDKGLGDGMRVQPTGGVEPVLPADSRDVCRVVLSGLLTGGYDSDGRPGDEGIAVVLQPRDARGRAVGAPADVSVVVLDPALEGEAARVARWDVPAAETAAHLRNAGADRTIRLEMPWPSDPPVHSRLYLFVRYTTRDGRQLQAEGPIQIALAGQAAGRWVPAKPAASAPHPGRPADLGRPDPTEPRPIRPTPAVRTAAPQPPPSAGGPAQPKLRPPVWSPNRP
jgi:hypothetical protein